MITQSMRSSIISQLFEMARVKKTIDSSQYSTNHRITRDSSDLNKIMQGITLNPFRNQDNNLYVVSTGKATSDNLKKSFYAVERLEKRCVELIKMIE